jgi:hypothetical protein
MAERSKRGLSATQSRSTGMKGGNSSAARPKAAVAHGIPGPKLPDEKSVRVTRKTVNVKPLKLSRTARSPVDPNAVDHRHQVLDDAKPGRRR